MLLEVAYQNRYKLVRENRYQTALLWSCVYSYTIYCNKS